MRILIRTDASVKIGSGHLIRCLTLADQLCSKGAEVAFACCDLPGGMFDLLHARGYRHIKLSVDDSENHSQQVDAEASIKGAKQLFPDGVDWLVTDHYALDATWENLLRPHVRKLMVIDDLANRNHNCDLLLDQNYYRDLNQRYLGLLPDHCISRLGPAYVLLRPEFDEARQKLRKRDGTVRRILIFFGGADPSNQTKKAIEAFVFLGRPDIGVDVVVGTSNPNRNAIQTLCAEIPNMSFHCQVTNMAELILNADLAIGAGGVTMWERCSLGLPTITVVFAANQEQATKDVAEVGAVEYLGWFDRLNPNDYARAISKLLEDAQRVRKISDAALRVVQPKDQSLADEMRRLFMEIE